MEEAVALIDRIIREHKLIIKKTRSSEQLANDASALLGLEEAKESFVPGRLSPEQSLHKLQESLEKIGKGLQEHFNHEESGLLASFEKQGDRKLVTALTTLLIEHKSLSRRLADSKDHVAELVSGGLARQRWEASANDMRAYLSHTWKLLEAHVALENELLVRLRRHLKGENDR